jgi:D-amino peptidase
MRVLLWTDMEGMSRVEDHRECWPAFLQYWESGRRAFTDEVLAAVGGLLDGGASEVFVVDGHGLGWPNLLWDELPVGAGPADEHAWSDGFDAMFQVGFHARAGTPDGFMAHTMVPGLAVAADGTPLTESHIWAWLVGIPVLGISGDAALEKQLDGILEGTPFLPVKKAATRGHASPTETQRADSLSAIRAFAAACVRTSPDPLTRPERFTFSVALDPALAAGADGRAGLVRTGPAVLSKQVGDWGREAQPALQAAISAALEPLLAAQDGLDLSSAEALASQDVEKLGRCRSFYDGWADRDIEAWPRAT